MENIGFSTVLNFRLLLENIEGYSKRPESIFSKTSSAVINSISANKNLYKDKIEDKDLSENAEDIGLMMSVVFTPALQNDMRAAAPPLSVDFFGTTRKMQYLFANNAKINLFDYRNEGDSIFFAKEAYRIILLKYYSINIKNDSFLFYEYKKDGSSEYFMLNFDYSYVKVNIKGEKPNVSTDDLQKAAEKWDLDSLKKYIPPQLFEFEGVQFVSLSDITEIYTKKEKETAPQKEQTAEQQIQKTEDTEQKIASSERLSKIYEVIKNQCTLIHPTVDWKFMEIAGKIVDGEDLNMSDIVFDNVYPLFGASDVRGSASAKNDAARKDILSHLTLLKKIITKAYLNKPLLILDQINLILDKHIERISKKFTHLDETIIIDFVKSEIEPQFKHFRVEIPQVTKLIDEYYETINKDLGTIYSARQGYFESIKLINKTISNVLDKEQKKAQKIFPHYFEKIFGEGVDHTIYIGNSITQDDKFNTIFLKNIRLWQLTTMCEVARKVNIVSRKTPVPLEITNLVLAYDSPINIRYQAEKRRFGVETPIHARYESIKSQINKALVRSSSERLAQPGYLVVVYSNNQELLEYENYFEYLVTKRYIDKHIDKVFVEDFKNFTDLKALRAKILIN